MSLETYPIGAVQQLVEGVVDSLVGFQLGLTQSHQVIFDLLINPTV